METSLIRSAVRSATKSYQQQEAIVNSLIKPSQELTMMALRMTKPLEEMMSKHREMVKSINDLMAPMLKQAEEISRSLEPLRKLHSDWIASVYFLGANKKKQESKIQYLEQSLIRYENGEVFFALQSKPPRKKDSLHLTLLKALLFKSDDSGFISYDSLFEFFKQQGIDLGSNPRKKILDSKREFPRFLGIPTSYKGKNILDVVKGKGLRLYNPEIKVQKV